MGDSIYRALSGAVWVSLGLIGSFFHPGIVKLYVTTVRRRRIACPLCGWHRPLVSRSKTMQRDADGLPRWDIDPTEFPVLRYQDFKGDSDISSMIDEAGLREMADSPDPVVREQYARIRRQILKLTDMVK